MVRIGLKTEQGQEFFIDVPLEDIHNWELNLKEKAMSVNSVAKIIFSTLFQT